MTDRLTRDEVDKRRTWDLSALFRTVAAWEDELRAVEQDIDTVDVYKGKLGQGSSILLACLRADEALEERLIRVQTYASLHDCANGRDAQNQTRMGLVGDLVSRVSARLSFVESEIGELPAGTVERYLHEEPGLNNFRRTLTDILERAAHRLSPQTEQVLAALGEVLSSPYKVYLRAKSSDMRFDPILGADGSAQPVSLALFEDRYEQSAHTAERRAARDSFARTLTGYENTFAATYAAEVKKQVVLARLRNYDSVTAMLLAPQKVTQQMYDNQIDVIQTELAPHMRRLARLRQRVLGLDKLYHCDLKAPLDPDFNPHTSIDDGGRLIVEALSILGPEYHEIVQTAVANRWIDYVDNVGKSTGAFCSSPYGAHSFILMTWIDTLRSVFVLAHELGHAGHFTLAQRQQSLFNTRPSMYFIEAPSTMNEMLLGRHILAQTQDARMRRWVTLQLLGTYYHNFVTHLLEAQFQRRVYALATAGEQLTAKLLCQETGDILESFWGDTVEIDDAARLTWMRQPHYYMGLYPYTYSAGLTVSTVVSQQIIEQGQPAVDRWLRVLKAGGTLPPLDLMKLAGVDMSTPAPIRQAVAFVGTLVDELERSF